ncbi:MAG: YkgJ family cysteine cluster protein [Desulfuromonadales bacterium]|nr:YkgJ family cysteine cluster protein [Desulfuromonadales bacterium]
MQDLLTRYQGLLEEMDAWFADCIRHAGAQITCHAGCSSCCRGLFEISLLDARLLQDGFALLDAQTREDVLGKAQQRVGELQTAWPEFRHPYILNRLPNEDWQEMPEDDPTPCPLLSTDGRCLVYAHRPMTCRLHGLPNIDCSGESFSDEYCTLNFKKRDPLKMKGLRYPFRETFAREFDLLGEFAQKLLGFRQLELDTFIASALLIDFAGLGEEADA